VRESKAKKWRNDAYWSPDGRMKWLSRGRERKKREKNASPVLHGAPHTCPRINRKCSCVWPPPPPKNKKKIKKYSAFLKVFHHSLYIRLNLFWLKDV